MDYQEINATTIDAWCREGWQWGKPIDHETYLRAQRGDWQVLLTPTRPVPHAWFGELAGCRLLGLASGGGQQIPVFAACGAQCTVLDYSAQQCESERLVASREGYEVTILQADMTQPLPFPDEYFDLIFHPVSNCYVAEVEPIFRECYRILRHGGVLLGGFDNGLNYAFDEAQERLTCRLPYNPLSDPALYAQVLAANDGIQFSHTLDEQLGGQLRAGFVLMDLYEDTNGEGNLHEHNVPCFVATRAVKP